VPSASLQSAEIVTLALTSTVGGALVDGTLIQQGGPIQFVPASMARVRLVTAFPANGSSNSSVAATVGGTALPALISPSVGTYQLVPGGSSSYDVTVDGTAATEAPTASFANGGDYTIVVYGSPTSPAVAVYADDNQTTSGGANIRLANEALPAGGLTIEDDYVPVDSNVQYGAASSYAGVTASSESLLQISSPVASFPTYTASNVNIQAGSVYTFFVLGTASAPIEVLSKDR